MGHTAAQRNWIKASPERRVRLAEQIGDDGARALAKSKGYEPLFDGFGRSLPQGPDQVYRTADGKIIAIEAKGGTSSLGRGYGYVQGTPEWAVESAKRVLRSFLAGPHEKAAARQILEAADRGQLEVHVVRTRHVLGEPTAAVLESVATATDDAARLARSALGHTSWSPGELSDDVARSSAVARTGLSTTDDVARGVKAVTSTRTAGKALAVVGVAVDAGYRVSDAYEVERQFSASQISEVERETAHAKNAAGMAGGWGGALLGAKSGATAGGMIAGPWGAGICGALGAIGGYFGGEAVGEAAAGWTMNSLHGSTSADD